MEGGNGEVRRVNVVYFLSRLGHVEHPHLIRVHHHSRNGVFLRDVKKWLADLRGSEMPDAFSWSYKRRYKNGYVWQDLFDDDLITPISDNEYVLKGSEILLTSPMVHSSYGERKSWASRNGNQEAEEKRNSVSTDSSRNSTSEIYKESPVFGSWKSAATTTDESTVVHIDEEKRVSKNQKPRKSDDFQHMIGTDKISAEGEERPTENGGSGGDSARPSVSSESSKSSTYMRSKSYSSGASHMLRNLITCGGQDIRDAVLVPLRRSTGISSAPWEGEHQHQHQHSARKSFDEAWSGLKMKETIELCRPKLASSKPSMGPFCSQCGKSFKPEKMHSHMKVCRGMKNSSTISTATSDEKTQSQRHRDLPDNLSTRPRVLVARCLNE